LPVCACSTSLAICASWVSEPTRVARTISRPPALTVAPTTVSPGPTSTGTDSPVSLLTSKADAPSSTCPETDPPRTPAASGRLRRAAPATAPARNLPRTRPARRPAPAVRRPRDVGCRRGPSPTRQPPQHPRGKGERVAGSDELLPLRHEVHRAPPAARHTNGSKGRRTSRWLRLIDTGRKRSGSSRTKRGSGLVRPDVLDSALVIYF
jgi:hypothetical protein